MLTRVVVCGVLLFFAGCASVNPREDYERTAALITGAAGRAVVAPQEIVPDAAPDVENILRDGLTLDESLRLALMNNPGLQAAFRDIGMARADLVQSGLFTNPSFSLAVALPAPIDNNNTQAAIAQNIVELWMIPVRKRAAQHALDAAVLTVAHRAVQLAADTRAAYYLGVGAGHIRRIADENIGVAKRLLDAAEARRAAGTAGELDLNLARGSFVNAEVEAEKARLDEISALYQLSQLLGLSVRSEKLTLSDPLPQPPTAALVDAPVVQLARASRLDVRAADEAVEAARARVELQRRSVWTNVSPGAAWWSPSDSGPSIALTLPVFDQNQAQIARARFNLEKAEKERDALVLTVTQAIRETLARAETNWKIARTFENELVPQTAKSLEMSQESYRAGRTTLLVVLESQRALLDAQRSSIAARQAAAISVADLERAVSRRLPDILDATGVPSRVESPAFVNPSISGERP